MLPLQCTPFLRSFLAAMYTINRWSRSRRTWVTRLRSDGCPGFWAALCHFITCRALSASVLVMIATAGFILREELPKIQIVLRSCGTVGSVSLRTSASVRREYPFVNSRSFWRKSVQPRPACKRDATRFWSSRTAHLDSTIEPPAEKHASTPTHNNGIQTKKFTAATTVRRKIHTLRRRPL